MSDLPPQARKEARRIKWFVGAHVCAVLVIYGVAMAVGGSLAAAPMPAEHAAAKPATPATAAAPSTPAALAPSPTMPPATPPVQSAWEPRAAADVPAPWIQDTSGSVRWRTE